MKSIGTKFLLVTGMIVILFFGVNVWRTWFSIHKHTEELTAKQAELALQFDLAIRHYVGGKVRPIMEQLVKKDEFIPEAMSTSFVARSVFEEVRKEFPDYVIKFASDNPRNPANVAGPEEMKILQYFRDTPDATEWTGQVRMNGREYFVRSIPRLMEQSCLHCHGRPEDAPASLVARYGPKAGFHQSPGDVMALDTVGIPMAKVVRRLHRN
jgi:two-component system, cell cycle sensor histidine kinase and response regulator CckA